MNTTCPHCGNEIPEQAHFCPRCAQALNTRAAVSPPRAVPARAVGAAIALLLCAALALALWSCVRPKTFSGSGEVVYTDGDGSYRLRLGIPGQAGAPLTEVGRSVELGRDCSETLTLCATDMDSGTVANETFSQKIAGCSISFDNDEKALTFLCQSRNIKPTGSGAARAFYVSYSLDRMTDCGVMITLTLEMRNGDTVNINQLWQFHAVRTIELTPADAPMDTSAQLQTLLDSLNDTFGPDTAVNIYLPAVTYDAPIAVSSHPVNLNGACLAQSRTTFAGGVSVSSQGKSYFENLAFTGASKDTGVSASGHLELRGCTFSGWETGLEGIGSAWVCCMSCVFEDCGVGFRFNSSGSRAMNQMYSENIFRGNGTAVLLESVPAGAAMNFDGCIFSGNGTDIDNRCAQELYITEASFG